MRRWPLLPISLLVACTILHAQEQDTPLYRRAPWFGAYGHYGMNTHRADFRQLPGIPNCCPRFETGRGSGVAFGLLYELPVFPRISFMLRAGYTPWSGVLEATEGTRLLVDGVATDGTFTHTVDASLATLGIEPGVGWHIVDALSVNVSLGLGHLLSATYAQKEQITRPAFAGTFVDSLGGDSGKRVRNERSGSIPDANPFQVAGIIGLSYDLALNPERTFVLAPEVRYAVGLTPVADDMAWKVDALRLGISVKYAIGHEPARIAEVPADSAEIQWLTTEHVTDYGGGIVMRKPADKDTTVEPPSLPSSGVEADSGVVAFRQGTDNLQQWLASNSTVVLEAVQFEFDKATLTKEAEVELDALAESLLRSADMRIELSAHTDNVGSAAYNMQLSDRRAKAVADYLIGRGVVRSRLTYVGYGDGQPVANNATPQGRSKNRRVQFRFLK